MEEKQIHSNICCFFLKVAFAIILRDCKSVFYTIALIKVRYLDCVVI